MKYKIAIHRDPEGISISVPALPGCWSEGDTEQEALANIKDAIREYLDALAAWDPRAGAGWLPHRSVANPPLKAY
jgi:predicted RNase H-like HicB family nuclease